MAENSNYDPYLSELFKRTIRKESDSCEPEELRRIQMLIDTGNYKQALENLILFVKYNDELEEEASNLAGQVCSLHDMVNEYSEKTTAALHERARYAGLAKEARTLVRRFLDFDLRGSDIDCLPLREVLEDAEQFINRTDKETFENGRL